MEWRAGVSVLIAPDLGTFFDPDHVVAPDAAKLGIAAFPGVGEDPGMQRFFTAFALLVGTREHPGPDHGQPLAAVQVPKLRADRNSALLPGRGLSGHWGHRPGFAACVLGQTMRRAR